MIDGQEIQQIVSNLKNGGIIAVPTDTVYGLAIDPKNRMAIRKLYKLKGRDSNKPLVHMIADKSMLDDLVGEITPDVQKIIDQYWPGALTIVFREKYSNNTIGIRIPDNQFMLALLNGWKKPLAVTSANISGEPDLKSMQKIEKKFGNKIDTYVYNDISCSGIASTVIDVSSGDLKILRQGDIKL